METLHVSVASRSGLPRSTESQTDTAVINEILFAPASSSQEFIELYNPSNDPINLCRLTFSDDRNVETAICEGMQSLLPDSFAVLARDSMALKQQFNHIQSRIFEPTSWPALNNTGDAVRLYADGILIDEVNYDPSWGAAGNSLERKDPFGPSAAAFNWGASIHFLGATPGFQNSIFAPDKTPPKLLLAEVSFPSTIKLIWLEPIDLTNLATTQFEVGHMAPYGIVANSASETILTFGTLEGHDQIRYKDIRDQTGNQSAEQSHPLAFVPEPGDLIINEIMYAPRTDDFDHKPDQPEYVELFNTASRLLSLRGLSLVGKPDEEGYADTSRSSAKYPTSLPGSFAVFFSANSYAENPIERFLQAFPTAHFDTPEVTLLPVSKASLGLLNTGDLIDIVAEDSIQVDALAYSPDWHHPHLEDTRGIALERRSLQPNGISSSNWSSSVSPHGGTPGQTNSINLQESEAPFTGSVHVEPSIFSPDGDGRNDVLPVHFSLFSSSQVLEIQIYDINGRRVRTLVPPTIVGQQGTFFWDGSDNEGQLLPIGVYIIAVEALDVRGGTAYFFKKPAVLALPLN